MRERVRSFVCGHRKWGRALLGVFLAPCLWLAVGALFTPLPPALREGARYGASVRFVDRNGDLLREVRADDAARALWVPLDEIGDTVVAAIVAAEDRRFEHHLGVDPAAAVRAAGTSLASRRVVSGASTITMQLARLVVPHPRNRDALTREGLRGKLGEMAMATRIEASLSKREILEQYLNRAPFGSGVRGIGAASRYFFDKPPRELSLAEAATLAGIPRGPAYYSLVRHPDRVLVRRDRVLDRMLVAKSVDPEAYARAKGEPLTLQIGRGGFGAPHLVDALLAGTLDPALPALRGATASVETTIDRSLQREVELATSDVVRSLAKRHVTAASAIVIDNATGDVLAYVGSPRWDDDANGGKNDGVRAKRQPGSTLKPFVYALAMEDLGWTPATLLPDVELHLDTPGGIYSPRNYDERFHGPVRLREALASSLNVPAVYAANEIGVARVLERLRDVGLETLTETAELYGPALALGDGEVRLVDLTAAYAALARGGVVRPLRVVRSAGDVALPAAEDRRVLPEPYAALVADILRDRTARIAAFGPHSALDLPFEVAAKTGTSKSYRDNWTVGFTRRVTVGVWVGNFDGSPMTDVSGITGAAPLFATAIAAAERRYPDGGPTKLSADVVKARVCALSGGAPGQGCKHVVDELIPATATLAPCDVHQVVRIDTRNDLRAGEGCPSRHVALRTFESYDGAFVAWARAAGRKTAPEEWSPFCPAGIDAHHRAEVSIRYPHDGARFLIDPNRPTSAQQIPLKVDAPASAVIAYFIDGKLAAQRRPSDPLYWQLEPGRHEITVESSGYRSDPVTITVQ